MSKLFNLILFLLSLPLGHSFRYLIPVKAELLNGNENYVRNLSFFLERYEKRGSDVFFFNIIGENLHPWGNNITINLDIKEYNKENSFLKMRFKLCDLLGKDPFLGKTLAKAMNYKNFVCPIPAMHYQLRNMSLNLGNIVWKVPRLKINIFLKHTPSQDTVATGFGVFEIKDIKNGKKLTT